MSDKDDKTSTPQTDSDPVRGLKRAVGRLFKPKEDKLNKALSTISSIQACKDAAITGEEEVRLLAVCRLGDYGSKSFDTLDITLNDESRVIRAMTAGVFASIKDNRAIPILKAHASDDDEMVREAIGFALGWLGNRGHDVDDEPLIPDEIPEKEQIVESTPIRTSDDILVTNGYQVSDTKLLFRSTIANKSTERISNVTIRIMSFPADSLLAPYGSTQIIPSIGPGESDSVEFEFFVNAEAIEGEIVSSVIFLNGDDEKIAAKSGICFIRSIYSQIEPFEMTADEFQAMKKGKSTWNREHVIEVEAKTLYKLVKKLANRCNLHSFRAESTTKEGMLMGLVAGAGIGKFSDTRLAVTITLVGKVGEGISKVRIDVMSDDSELIQIAASEFFERLQIEIQAIE
ncbi:MAG: HEAT repeat domain-containing protein [Candidatus Thorarchaeota archaeon]